MKMRKVLAIVISAVMVLSMIPAMAFTTTAAETGLFTTYRSAKDYPQDGESEDDYEYSKAGSGYEYNADGFSTISPNMTGATPWVSVQTLDKYSLNEGIYMEIRIDSFQYTGEYHDVDSWISLNISDTQKINVGDPKYGSGWFSLIRGNGGGETAEVQSFNVHGSFLHVGSTHVEPGESGGCEVYTLEVKNGSILVNGVEIAGNADVMKALTDDSYYIGVAMQNGIAGDAASLTITKFGTSKENATTPVGNDKKAPDENLSIPADDMDPDLVPKNKPALLWNADIVDDKGWVVDKSVMKKEPTGAGDLEWAPQGDNSYHLTAHVGAVYFTLGVKRGISFTADDFPTVAILFKNLPLEGGSLYACAGEAMAPGPNCLFNWGSAEVEKTWEEGDDTYTFVVVDLEYSWSGRIHQIRMDFGGLVADAEDPNNYGEWDVMWAGAFRNPDEALAYLNGESGEDTDDTKDEDTGAVNPDDTKAPDDTKTPDDTKAPDDTKKSDDTVKETVADTKKPADTKKADDTKKSEETKSEEKGGCASVVGVGVVAVAMVAAAGVVVLKKKED